MSAIITCSERRRDVARLCATLGLADHANVIRSTLGDRPGELRNLLLKARIAAHAVAAAALCAHESAQGMVVVDTVLGRLTERASNLDNAITLALEAVDAVIAEQHADAEKGVAPGLRPLARPYRGARSTDR